MVEAMHGAEAIEYAEAHGLTLRKYTDPTEDGREGLTVDEACEVAREDPMLIWLDAADLVYEAVRYAADGHQGEVGDGTVIETGTLDACRLAIAERIGMRNPGLSWLPEQATRWLPDYRWDGAPAGAVDDDDPGDVEAYHESDEEGCGGWAIRRA